MQKQKDHQQHIPVLLEATLKVLDPHSGDSYLDVTGGYGGHASAILERTLNPKEAVLVDRDLAAVESLKKRFGSSVQVEHGDFHFIARTLLEKKKRFDVILADLGISSPHIDNKDRGFAIAHDGPLDMRMDQGQVKTAALFVNSSSEEELARIIREFGEEPKAKRIAAAIVAARPLLTTHQLAEVISKVAPKRYSQRIHPATKTFQAIRIAVNDELMLLKNALPIWVELLKPGGRLGVISFHSLEDRIVKQFFNQVAGERYDSDLRLLTKKPITASPHELDLNPRARSAKLRAVVKINNNERSA